IIVSRRAGTCVVCPACQGAVTVPPKSNRARRRSAGAGPQEPMPDGAAPGILVGMPMNSPADAPVCAGPPDARMAVAIAAEEGDSAIKTEAPCVAAPATSPGQRRRTAATLAAGLFAVAGLGALAVFAALGGDAKDEPPQAPPPAARGAPPGAVAARLTDSPDRHAVPAPAATKPEQERAVEAERPLGVSAGPPTA